MGSPFPDYAVNYSTVSVMRSTCFNTARLLSSVDPSFIITKQCSLAVADVCNRLRILNNKTESDWSGLNAGITPRRSVCI